MKISIVKFVDEYGVEKEGYVAKRNKKGQREGINNTLPRVYEHLGLDDNMLYESLNARDVILIWIFPCSHVIIMNICSAWRHVYGCKENEYCR